MKLSYLYFFSQEEVRKILSSFENLKHKDILKTIYCCGLRLSELINLKFNYRTFFTQLIGYNFFPRFNFKILVTDYPTKTTRNLFDKMTKYTFSSKWLHYT